MRLKEMAWHAPGTLEEAARALAELGGSACVLAGGTDLLADMKQGKLDADHLVSLGGIAVLREIHDGDGGLWIGALAAPNAIAKSPEIRRRLPALAEAAAVMGGHQIRNLATIGGNLASAVPSADLPPSLLVAGAEVRLVRADGERRVPVAELFTGPRATVIEAGEILAAVHVPPTAGSIGSAYVKFQLRDASALAVVGVAALLTLDEGKVALARVAVGAAAPTPVLVPEAAAILEGEPPGEEIFRRAGEAAAAAVRPIDDLRGSAEYRRSITAVLTARALGKAHARALGREEL